MVKVMLADCDKMERDRLEQAITEEKGLQLCGSTGNGKELVELAKQVHPNVIVMDLVLPYMDGISVLEALQQEMAEERPEVIVLTRIQSETMLQAAIAGGAAYYILKPYDKKRLMNRIYEAGRAEETSMEFYSVPPARKRCDTLEQEIDRRISAALRDFMRKPQGHIATELQKYNGKENLQIFTFTSFYYLFFVFVCT